MGMGSFEISYDNGWSLNRSMFSIRDRSLFSKIMLLSLFRCVQPQIKLRHSHIPFFQEMFLLEWAYQWFVFLKSYRRRYTKCIQLRVWERKQRLINVLFSFFLRKLVSFSFGNTRKKLPFIVLLQCGSPPHIKTTFLLFYNQMFSEQLIFFAEFLWRKK